MILASQLSGMPALFRGHKTLTLINQQFHLTHRIHVSTPLYTYQDAEGIVAELEMHMDYGRIM